MPAWQWAAIGAFIAAGVFLVIASLIPESPNA
jgi:hypothetical protein